MKLSIVTTLYNSSPYIQEFYERVSSVASEIVGSDYEILFVNDGSPDDSLNITINLAKKDEHIIVVDLSRNFGHHKAMMTGLENATGEFIFLIDSDLEEEPEWLYEFYQELNNKNCDVVYGIQKNRKGGFFERWSGYWFYKIFQIFTGLNLPNNIVTARLMSRRYVNALLLHKEREIMIAGLWQITGFEQEPKIIIKHNTSKTTYTIRRKLSVLVNSITSFSNLPLIAIFYIGVSILLLSGIYSIYLFIHWMFLGNPLSGWTSVMASIWFLGGLIISFIGILGIYISKIFSETKQRPYTIIRDIYSFRKES